MAINELIDKKKKNIITTVYFLNKRTKTLYVYLGFIRGFIYLTMIMIMTIMAKMMTLIIMMITVRLNIASSLAPHKKSTL